MAQPSPVPKLSPRPSALDFLVGARLPFSAMRLVLRSRKLVLLSALSGAVTLASLVVLAWVAWRYSNPLLSALWARPQSWYGEAAWELALALTFLGILAVGANTLPLALQAPLQDPISEAAEELCGGFAPKEGSLGGFFRGLATSLAHVLARIALLLAGHAVLLPLNLVPGIGSAAWGIAASAWTMAWAGIEYLGAPMARHLYRFSEVRRAFRRRPALAMGFGAAVYVLLWVPLLNLFFVPLAIVGGTVWYRALAAAGALPPPPDAPPRASAPPGG